MFNCAKCNSVFNDGAQCGQCQKYFDYGCAGISEAGFRKLGQERRATWKCPACKLNPLTPQTRSGEDKFDTILSEIRELKQQLAKIPTLVNDIKGIKEELIELKKSCEFSSTTIDEFSHRLTTVEKVIPELNHLQVDLASTKEEVSQLKRELSARDQWFRSNNAEIKGVPLKNHENLYSIVNNISNVVGYSFPQSCVNYISRIPVHNSKEKHIVVSFVNRYVKEEFLAAARARKNLSADEIGFRDMTQKIYVNDHLSPDYKQLLTKTKTIAKERIYRFVWVKFGKIHVRKDAEEKTRVFIINNTNDLNKLV